MSRAVVVRPGRRPAARAAAAGGPRQDEAAALAGAGVAGAGVLGDVEAAVDPESDEPVDGVDEDSAEPVPDGAAGTDEDLAPERASFR